MTQDVMTQYYTCLNLPLQEKLVELSRIIDQCSSNKDLQSLFPQLINNIFNSTFTNGWGLRTVTFESNRYEFELFISFFEPQGPMLRLCYKLLSDPSLKYSFPLNLLPPDLQLTLERGRYPQFYAELLNMDPQTMNVASLALNPFDYYMFNFALHLLNNNQNKSWENWNSAYFALVCDYLVHFLPADPNVPVLPLIPNYTGKMSMMAPLQTATRPLCTTSLLLLPDISGINTQHQSPQSQSRNEIWRSETVLQVFIDVWMCVEQFSSRNVEAYQRNYPTVVSSPERVRIVRVLVKHIHSFSAKHLSDTAIRSSALRKYACQIMCTRAYHYVKHLMTTWPLDASFRLVMELWLSLIQPWRYNENSINQDRYPNNNQEESHPNTLDSSFTQFIAENYPSYTCLFQMVVPRFMRLDLTAYKNAIMLFRLGKVFSQPHLVQILRDIERAMTENTSRSYTSFDSSYNSSFDQSMTLSSAALHKWVPVAKQAISELNLSTTFEYEPIWSEIKKQFALEFIKKIAAAKVSSETILEVLTKRVDENNKGVWSGIKHFFMLGNKDENELSLEECKKVPTYLNTSIHYFINVYGLNENTLLPADPMVEDISAENSSFGNITTNFPNYITNKMRSKPTNIHFMGDPDLMPITSYESTILIRMFYQIASKINEVYHEDMVRLWNKPGFWGHFTREILQSPCTIHKYVKDITNHQNIVNEDLPPRLSLRKFGSYSFVMWIFIGYMLFRIMSMSGYFYAFLLFCVWFVFFSTKATLSLMRNVARQE